MSSCKVVSSTARDIFSFPFAFSTDLGEVNLSEHEKRVLNRNFRDFVWQSGFSQSFLAWRRRLLYSSAILLGIAVSIEITQTGLNGILAKDETIYTTLGLVAIVGRRIEPWISLTTTLVAAMCWTDYRKSRIAVSTGWSIGLFLVMWSTLVPLQYMLDDTTYPVIALMGAVSALSVLPMYLALIGGLTLGARRVYFFAPSPLTGAIVVLSAMFNVIIPFAALNLMVQLVGNAVFLFGCYLLVAGPILIILNARKFTFDNVFSSNESILVSKRIYFACSIVRGLGMIVIFAWGLIELESTVEAAVGLVQEEETRETIESSVEEYISMLGIFELFVGFLGNMMLQAVLWTDVMIYVSRQDDIKMRKLTSDLLG